jgi:hypothetical protein
MRSLCFLVVAAGCGFHVSTAADGDGTDIDAAAIDAPADPGIDAPDVPPIDAPPDAPPDAAIDAPPPTWTIVDTLTVSCRGITATGTFVLMTGVTYRLRASDECIANTANNSRQDAEFLGYNVGPTYDSYGGVDNGIAINDPDTDAAAKQPTWGAYNATTHTYEVDWIGANATITATFHGGNLTNNSGSLTLRVLALQ